MDFDATLELAGMFSVHACGQWHEFVLNSMNLHVHTYVWFGFELHVFYTYEECVLMYLNRVVFFYIEYQIDKTAQPYAEQHKMADQNMNL